MSSDNTMEDDGNPIVEEHINEIEICSSGYGEVMEENNAADSNVGVDGGVQREDRVDGNDDDSSSKLETVVVTENDDGNVADVMIIMDSDNDDAVEEGGSGGGGEVEEPTPMEGEGALVIDNTENEGEALNDSVEIIEDDDYDGDVEIISVEAKVLEDPEVVIVEDDDEDVEGDGAMGDQQEVVMGSNDDNYIHATVGVDNAGQEDELPEDSIMMDAPIPVTQADQEEEERAEPRLTDLAKETISKGLSLSELAKQPRQLMNQKHPKFRDLNNMAIINKMVEKGKVVNPADDEEEDDLFFTKGERDTLSKKGIEILEEFRRPQDRNGNDVLHSSLTRVLYLGGGIPLEPVLAHTKLNEEVEAFRKELTKHRRNWERVFFRHPKRKAGLKVDPSSIVPASVSGSTGSSSIGSETDPECLATDDESESELIPGSISAWIVPQERSRSPSPAEPEFEIEEPEFIIRPGSHQAGVSSEPPAKKRKQKHEPQPHPVDGKVYPKPGFSYSCLIAMSLKNSKTGCLPVSEIYKFMCDHFPYFKTAPSGWKNSVRHNLSLNKCFEKIEKPGNGARKGCLWALNPAKVHKMDEEVQKWSRKDPLSIRKAMSDPENLELLERGELKKDYSGNGSDEDEDEEFVDASGSIVNPAQLIVRKVNGQSTTVASPVQYTTVSQVHASMHRPADQKIHAAPKKEDALEFGTITNVQGNYICTTPGAQTYTLSFSNLGSSAPIIIRRTQVK